MTLLVLNNQAQYCCSVSLNSICERYSCHFEVPDFSDNNEIIPSKVKNSSKVEFYGYFSDNCSYYMQCQKKVCILNACIFLIIHCSGFKTFYMLYS